MLRTWRFVRCARLAPLAVILVAQAAVSVSLARTNTAFVDEATYLGGAHDLLRAWIQGGPNLHFPTYFSGAPVVYPVLGALIDSVGGLFAARMFSLACMLAATTLAYGCARRLGGITAGWLAAAVFATMEGTLFLGALATYDAMALALIAFATWIVIRAGMTLTAEPHSAIFWAAPVLALANATKYASALYDPVVLLLAFLVVADVHGRHHGVRVAGVLTALTAALLSALVGLAGANYASGITSTTLTRAAGTSAPTMILRDATLWVGPIAALAVVATLVLFACARKGGTTWLSVAVGAVLAAATLLAPANQARIHTATSLSKHVDFGAWFGALAAGWLLARLASRDRRNVWRVLTVACVTVALFAIGARQARGQVRHWVNTRQFIETLRPIVGQTTGPMLIDEAPVAAYYLGDDIPPSRWLNTFYLRYVPPGTTVPLTGLSAYASAIRNNAFAIVALDFGAENSVDTVVARELARNSRYRVVAKVSVHDAYGAFTFTIWRLQGS